MKKFTAVEGLRGWLAWTVVIAHTAYTSGIYLNHFGAVLGRAGYPAVLTFIIISGFVITHLHIERPEPYLVYLLRRFMRIFPLFMVTSVIGYFAYDVQATTLVHVSYAHNPGFDFGSEVADIAWSDHAFFWSEGFAHLTMMHGAISDALLKNSSYAFNMPAWSLSLEWQFYLVAPAILFLLRRQRPALLFLGLIAGILEVACQKSVFGHFAQPSFLPAATGYFAVGIASRLAYPAIAGGVRNPTIAAALVLVLLPLSDAQSIPLLLWILVMARLVSDETIFNDTFTTHCYRLLLESPLATYFGTRSFSVYLCHMAVITFCHWILLRAYPSLGPLQTFMSLMAMAVPLTIGAAELLYRGIERPGIRIGSLLAGRSSRLRVPDIKPNPSSDRAWLPLAGSARPQL